jgi:ParG protein
VRSIADQEIKRLNINIEVDLHNAFKAATAARGENMTDVLLQYIQDYVTRHGYNSKKKKERR